MQGRWMAAEWMGLALAALVSSSVLFSADLTAWEKRAAQLSYPNLPSEITSHTPFNPHVTQLDPLISQDWGLASIGFFESFTPLTQPVQPTTQNCSKEIIVGVVDTGIDYNHPELRENLWTNRGEVGAWTPSNQSSNSACRDKSCNGIDDDGNGFIDDVVGWDFVNDIPLPYDTHGHGTHISGIIAASSANGIGISGVCPRVRIMALKYYDSSGAGFNNLQNTVKAIRYATKMGANIINYSGGGAEPAAAERAAIEDARTKGVLFIAAAGNDAHDNDVTPYFPANYPLDNIISVASINRQDQLLPSSNFGKTVQVAAPGLSILSTLPGGRYGTMSGTSQATAFVTGAAALLASQFKEAKDFDYHLVKAWVNQGTHSMPNADSKKTLVSFGILSIPGSLKQAAGSLGAKNVPALALETRPKKKTVIR